MCASLEDAQSLGLVLRVGDPEDCLFTFRHALTQDAIAQGLLAPERAELHFKVARAHESRYADRLAEYYETIAFHFEQARAVREAVDYLARAGEKSLQRYAVAQASQYFRRAYDLARGDPEVSRDRRTIADLVVRWARADYYLGSFRELEARFIAHSGELQDLPAALRANYEIWMGTVFWHRQSLARARSHLERGRAFAVDSATRHSSRSPMLNSRTAVPTWGSSLRPPAARTAPARLRGRWRPTTSCGRRRSAALATCAGVPGRSPRPSTQAASWSPTARRTPTSAAWPSATG